MRNRTYFYTYPLIKDYDSLFDQVFEDVFSYKPNAFNFKKIKVDDKLEVTLDLPGYSKDTVETFFSKNILEINLHKLESQEREIEKTLKFDLSGDDKLQIQNAFATIQNGKLKIIIPIEKENKVQIKLS